MNDRTENHISGGVFFGVVIQGRTITLTLPDRPDPALAGLPRKSAVFVGRQAETERIHAALSPSAEPASGMVTVSGLAGAGKTELILQAAHQALREEGWFPGGVLFADLHGYDKQRKVSPKRALGTLLRALGIPAEHIPPGIEERANIYRSALAALAAAGQRVLVVLDDVPATEKIHYLLPSDGTTATLVSSRHSLSELGALNITLGVLSISSGRALLDATLRAARPGDSRVANETEEADRLIALCGGLPLALCIVSSLLADIPNRTLSSLHRLLKDAHSRLSALSREERAVTAAFDLSYRRLTKDQAKLFRLMWLNPGPDFSTQAAAQLHGGDEKETERLLQDLARRHLIEPSEPYGRWQLHTLLRLYAREKLMTGDDAWGEALARLLAHFHEMATLACQALFAPETPPTEAFTDRTAALQWLEVERPTLVAATAWSHQAKDDLVCAALAVPVSQFLMEARYSDDASRVLAAGIRSSRRQEDRRREAALLSSRGVVLRDLRMLRKSVRSHQKAIKICRKLRKRKALAGALNNLGLSLHDQREFEQAVAAHSESARLFKRGGDQLGAARALSNLGETLVELGRAEEAARILRKAGKIFRKQGDLRNYAQALGSLAMVMRNSGEAENAAELHRRALDMPNGLLLPHERAVEMSNFAGTLIASGRFEDALTAQQEALVTFRRLQDRRSEAMTLGNMALVRQRQEKWHKAIRLHTLALEAFLESEDDHALADELSSLAAALLQLGNNTEALENLELAAALYEQTGDAKRAGEALDLADQVRNRAGARREPAAGIGG
ncbi:tetratricopeptide repeat protein [Streptomyces sp. URMC 126]|uniref:tetratricopeptide repeat protein n=1 Tax=Streptomyces sp. URMC 126 TaxID=3423401 RepID=UPI003F196100